VIDVRDGWKQLGAFVRYREGDVRIRIGLTQRSNCGRGQDQIANSLELQKKNFHPPEQEAAVSKPPQAIWRSPLLEKIIVPCASQFRMRPANVFENGPR